MRKTLFVFAVATILGILTSMYREGFAQQPSTTLRNYQLIVENERVRIGHVTVEAGVSEGLHVHPYPRVLVCIQGATIEVKRQDGTVVRTTYRPGDARYQTNTDPHEPVNVGDTDFKGVVVELKQ